MRPARRIAIGLGAMILVAGFALLFTGHEGLRAAIALGSNNGHPVARLFKGGIVLSAVGAGMLAFAAAPPRRLTSSV